MYDLIVYRDQIVRRRCLGVALSRAWRTNVVITTIDAVAAVEAVVAVVGVRVLKRTKDLFERVTIILKDRPLSVR